MEVTRTTTRHTRREKRRLLYIQNTDDIKIFNSSPYYGGEREREKERAAGEGRLAIGWKGKAWECEREVGDDRQVQGASREVTYVLYVRSCRWSTSLQGFPGSLRVPPCLCRDGNNAR